MFSTRVFGQEAIRMSLASEAVAAAQKTSTSSNYYNIEAGPVFLRFQGEMGVEFNDNANYSSTNPDADIGLRPGVNVKAYWPVTEQNAVNLDTGIGYVQYLHDPSYSYLYINSDSSLNFKVYTGDVVLDLHDRFSAIEYQTQDPSVSANFIRLENTPGIKADWDLNQLILTAGFDYDMFDSLTGNYQYSDNDSELLSGQAAFLINSQNRLGVEMGGGFTTYQEHVLDNATHFNIGPFYQAQLTPYLGVEAHGGFAVYQFNHTGTITNVSDFNGFYAALSATHRLNSWFSHTISAGHQLQLGITSELSETYYLRYAGTWNVIRDGAVSLGMEYDHGITSGGIEETYNFYYPTAGVSYKLTEKVTGHITYNLLDKRSDVSVYSYVQNRLVIDFTYDF